MHLAGTVDIDLQKDSFGKDKDGNDVFFADIWPSTEEVNAVLNKVVTRELFQKEYETCISQQTKHGMQLKHQLNLYTHLMTNQLTFKTHHSSRVFLKSLKQFKGLDGLRVIAKFGDSITTDHISPAGAIGKDTPAGKYLHRKRCSNP